MIPNVTEILSVPLNGFSLPAFWHIKLWPLRIVHLVECIERSLSHLYLSGTLLALYFEQQRAQYVFIDHNINIVYTINYNK